MLECLDSTMNIVKAILYFGEHTKYKLYYTKLQLLLFYYEKEYFQLYEKKILKRDFLYNGYIPKSEGLDDLLVKLDFAEILKFADSDYGKYVDTLISLEKSEYKNEEIKILSKILERFDDLTANEIVKKFFEPELKENKIKTVTRTVVEF